MKIKQSGGSNIIGFPGELYRRDVNAGEKKILDYVERDILPRTNAEDAKEWSLTLLFTICRGNVFGALKRGGVNYPSEKDKEMFILVPIPDRSHKIKWGHPFDRHDRFDLSRPKTDPKKYVTIPFNYEDYDNVKSYIVDCGCRLLHEVFTQGYTIAGKKIRFVR
jgi:hypothetical protein